MPTPVLGGTLYEVSPYVEGGNQLSLNTFMFFTVAQEQKQVKFLVGIKKRSKGKFLDCFVSFKVIDRKFAGRQQPSSLQVIVYFNDLPVKL